MASAAVSVPKWTTRRTGERLRAVLRSRSSATASPLTRPINRLVPLTAGSLFRQHEAVSKRERGDIATTHEIPAVGDESSDNDLPTFRAQLWKMRPPAPKPTEHPRLPTTPN